MTCQSSHCLSIVWGQGNTSLRTADAFPVVASLPPKNSDAIFRIACIAGGIVGERFGGGAAVPVE